MKSKKVNTGFVGLGENGQAHLEAHLKNSKSNVVAIYDRNEQLLKTVGKKYGISKLYHDDSFYEDKNIDAITINTGDDEHYQPFIDSIRHGKHILIEKPVANTEQELIDMVTEAQKTDPSLKIQVGYILRFNPVFEEIHRLAHQGSLGNIYYLEGDYVHNLLCQRQMRNWKLEKEIPMVGGGSHPIDLLRWITGKEITRVTGFSCKFVFPEMTSDDCQVAIFQFTDKTIAKVAALYAPRMEMAPYYNLRVYGTSGTVERDQVAIARCDEDHHPQFKPVNATRTIGHPYDPEIEDWLDAILEDKPTRINFYDGANSTMATLCACRAITEGCSIEVPIFKPKK